MNLRPGLPQPPKQIARLPRHRGYPVPWFVAWLDEGAEVLPGKGEPDFRVIGSGRIVNAHRFKRCWVCGSPLGSRLAFNVGPMCAINRVSSEPPSHVECAEWAARACPFLTRPSMVRREAGLPTDAEEPAGTGLKRNPGVALVWITRSYSLRRVPGGVLFVMGEPESTVWLAEGRPATRPEIEESITSGLPLLREAAERDGAAAVQALGRMTEVALELLPT